MTHDLTLTGAQLNTVLDKASSIGTVATKDHGTASGEVPLNSDLGSIAIKGFWSGTQAQYDALDPPDTNIIHFIEKET